MKLVYILNHYSSSSSSHYHHVLNLLDVMAKKGVEIALIIEKCDEDPVIGNPRIKLYAQKQKNKYLRPIELFSILNKLGNDGFNHVFIRISWVAALVAIACSLFTGQKTFFWLSGTGGFEHYGKIPFGRKKIKEFFTSFVPFQIIKRYIYRFVTGPETMKQYYIEHGGVDHEKILVLYNDIDISRFSPSKKERKKHVDIIFVKRMSPIKGVCFYFPWIADELIKATNHKFKIHMFGDGSERAKAENAVRLANLDDVVKFYGAVPNKVIHEFYAAGDIFINPTLEEGFPRVLIEAMACGLPVVTTDVGGIRDILGPEQRDFMVAAKDRESFVSKLKHLVESDDSRSRLARENLRMAKRFSTESVADMYISGIFG